MIENKPGLLIAFEGIDGSGKDTQIEILYNKLMELNIDVCKASQLDDKSITGKAIREIFGTSKEVGGSLRIAMLYLSELVHNVEKVDGINDMLDQGKVVICNRYHYSTSAYLKRANCDATEKVIETVSNNLPIPDIVFYLDVETRRAVDRLTGFKDLWEQKNVLDKIKDAYTNMVRDNKHGNFISIDNNWKPEKAADTIYNLVEKLNIKPKETL